MLVLQGDKLACATYHTVQPTLNTQLQFQDMYSYFYYELWVMISVMILTRWHTWVITRWHLE